MTEKKQDQSWQDGYGYGWDQGYQAGVRAVNETWRTDSAWRPDVQPKQARFMIDGEWVTPLTWREREAERVATLREGHAAGLHAARPAYGCPECPA